MERYVAAKAMAVGTTSKTKKLARLVNNMRIMAGIGERVLWSELYKRAKEGGELPEKASGSFWWKDLGPIVWQKTMLEAANRNIPDLELSEIPKDGTLRMIQGPLTNLLRQGGTQYLDLIDGPNTTRESINQYKADKEALNKPLEDELSEVQFKENRGWNLTPEERATLIGFQKILENRRAKLKLELEGKRKALKIWDSLEKSMSRSTPILRWKKDFEVIDLDFYKKSKGQRSAMAKIKLKALDIVIPIVMNRAEAKKLHIALIEGKLVELQINPIILTKARADKLRNKYAQQKIGAAIKKVKELNLKPCRSDERSERFKTEDIEEAEVIFGMSFIYKVEDTSSAPPVIDQRSTKRKPLWIDVRKSEKLSRRQLICRAFVREFIRQYDFPALDHELRILINQIFKYYSLEKLEDVLAKCRKRRTAKPIGFILFTTMAKKACAR